jgi:hypothetical protein
MAILIAAMIGLAAVEVTEKTWTWGLLAGRAMMMN